MLRDTPVSASTYNKLPLIEEVQHVPESHSSDLTELRALLAKHSVPAGVSIRLIHKHYDVKDDEVMAFEDVAVPPHGTVKVMHPVKVSEVSGLRGTHFFVDEDGLLQSYEYTSLPSPDMSIYEPFLLEFCQIVVNRGLQMKYGLKLECDAHKTSWTEFEYPDKRSTVMIPEGMPTPEGKFDFQVITEWGSDLGACYGKCYHCGHQVTCDHCDHYAMEGHSEPEDMKFYLGPQKIEPGTPVWAIMSAVTEVC